MIDYARFQNLVPEARRTCIHFFERSEGEQDDYVSFFLLWMSFNSWMSCVTGMERDAEMIRDIGVDSRLNAAFVDLTTGEIDEQKYRFRQMLTNFSALWPIFKAQDVIARRGAEYSYRFGTRAEFNAAIIDDVRIKRSPAGWVHGSTARWSDLVSAIYQVRCNLIHGHKSTIREGDRELVRLSRELLFTFIGVSRCYEW